MDKTTLQTRCDARTRFVWAVLCEIRPALVKFDPPTIKLCGRLWRTAGNNVYWENRIELGYKFFFHSEEYYNEMMNVILPHELMHQADINLYGPFKQESPTSEEFHRPSWQKLMVDYGLPPNAFHNMEIPRK